MLDGKPRTYEESIKFLDKALEELKKQEEEEKQKKKIDHSK